MNKIKVVFLDIDNTLLDFDMAIRTGIENGFKKFNLGEFSEEMFSTFERINSKLWERLQKKEITFQQIKDTRFNLVFKELGVNFDGVKFEANFREFLFNYAYPVDGAIELLTYLKDKNYVVCAASNGPLNQQLNRLKVGKMYDLFDYIFVSEDLGFSKPNVEFFDACFSRMKEKYFKEQCVMIGDSLTSDIQGGINSEFKTIFFNKHNLVKPFKIVPDYEVLSLKEIENIL
ncbi:MAG: YjjG family noncanonical pyrimidine nucleotidase [Bacilli bacterium]|nr:YjjG family noncanonical pyrimidine nucleotidase [Bacilli bacterium]